MIDLNDPCFIADIFASGIAEAEDLGDGMMRITCFSRQRSTYDGASMDNNVVARIVMPLPAAVAAAGKMIKAAGVNCCGGRRMLVN